jgi:hypothetical protein
VKDENAQIKKRMENLRQKKTRILLTQNPPFKRTRTKQLANSAKSRGY